MTEIEVKNLIGDQIEFCQLTKEEFSNLYYDKMKSVGWKPIVDSAHAHSVLVNDSIFGLKHEETIIATLASAKYPVLGIAYMGFYIVDKKYRHSGLGRYLWEQTASLLKKEGYTIEFDSPPELVPYYTSLGYKEFSSMTIRGLQDRSKLITLSESKKTQKIDAITLSKVIEFDKKIIPEENRSGFLPLWFNKKYTKTAALIENNEVAGYGVMSKQFVEGHEDPYSYIIAPVYAKTPSTATAIIQSLCLQAEEDEPIFMDTLDCHPAAIEVAKSLGFEEIFPAHRLSSIGKLGEQRKKTILQVYAISSHAYAPL